MSDFLWVEKYRPRKIKDCILTEELKNTFTQFLKQKEIPNLLLSGSAGTGKTTVARALCEELGSDYIVINGSDEGRQIDTVRSKIKNFASTVSLTEDANHKVVIIDEADYMNADSVQPALRNFIETFYKNCRFIFTCNYKNKIIPALHSRLFNLGEANTKELVKILKDKRFNDMRKWVVQNLDKEASSLFKTLYDTLYTTLDAKSIPQAILIIAGYQYKSAFVADQEINMVACLTEIMAGCKFK